jgi:hypothetical protein
MKPVRLALVGLVVLLGFVPWHVQAAFDHAHSAWNQLVGRHVVVLEGGKASKVRYAAFAKDRAALKAYLDSLSAVNKSEFDGWSKAERLAFLINAYNAFTIELILRSYPDVGSIRDLGNIFRSPWRIRFFTLLGSEQNLDAIEHELIRQPGVFDEPRIHFAVNCASIGCPMLREEAYVAARLDLQLEDQTTRFLSDRSRNRYDPRQGALEVSKIFDWYRKDFESGLRGIESREAFFAGHADLLADLPSDRQAVTAGTVPIRFLDYDWSLNDARP